MEVTITAFAYTNIHGGTGLSKGMGALPAYPHPFAKVKIVKGWFDYETGCRFIAEPAEEQLAAYLEANGKPQQKNIYFSEYDLINRKQIITSLIAKFIDTEES